MDYLGIDIGTSFIKGGVLDIDNCKLDAVERIPSPEPYSDEQGMLHEVDPARFISAVRQIIGRLMAASDGCAGIVICGQMGDLVLTDDLGEAKFRYISWLDRRSLLEHPSGRGTYFDLYSERLGTKWPARLGNEVRPGLPLAFLFWLEQNSQLLDGSIPVTLPDYVASNLCGVKLVMEWTSTTSTLDVETRSWPGELIKQLNLERLAWPEIVDFRHQVGHCEIESARIPVYAAVGDHQCAVAGTLLQEGELSINISTGSQVAMIAPDATVGDYQLRPFFDAHNLRTITNIPAGRSLATLVKLLMEIPAAQKIELDDPWDYVFQQAERILDSDMVSNLAFFPGSVEGPGQLSNLHEGNLSVGHLFRSALETMAGYYERFAQRLSPAGDWQRIVFSGGIAQRSELLRRLICDRLKDQYRLTSSTEDTMIGLMVLARVVSGLDQTTGEASDAVRRNIQA